MKKTIGLFGGWFLSVWMGICGLPQTGAASPADGVTLRAATDNGSREVPVARQRVWAVSHADRNGAHAAEAVGR
jgi:hypothetical protein